MVTEALNLAASQSSPVPQSLSLKSYKAPTSPAVAWSMLSALDHFAQACV